MTILADLAAWSLGAFTLLLFIMQFVAQEFGQWIGRRQRTRGEGKVEGVGIVVGGMLGLLAFVLALTLNFATS
jgi:MFS family permease